MMRPQRQSIFMQKRLNLPQQDALIGFLLILPSLLIILGISLQPILTTLYLSLFETTLGRITPDRFVWFSNYSNLLSNSLRCIDSANCFITEPSNLVRALFNDSAWLRISCT